MYFCLVYDGKREKRLGRNVLQKIYFERYDNDKF